MVKVLLKKSIEDAGVFVEITKKDMSVPHVINHADATFVKSPIPETLKLCGSCKHMQIGKPGNPMAGGWHCTVDSKAIPDHGACRNGGWDPEVVVYRKVKRLTVVSVPADTEAPSEASEAFFGPDTTVVVPSPNNRLPASAYVAAFLFMAASALATLWVLQSAACVP
jgi:hypothetical protein